MELLLLFLNKLFPSVLFILFVENNELKALIDKIKEGMDETQSALISEDLLSIVSNYQLASDKIKEIEEELEKVMAQISQDMGAEPPSKEDVKEVLDHLDTDHSGQIDFEEFSQLIKDVLAAMIEEDN